jgi:hypothetical protein
MKLTDLARTQLSKLPPAVSGSGGHDATFRAACFLARFGFADGVAMALLAEWNQTHCIPPWSERELAHKWADARKAVGLEAVRRLGPARPANKVHWPIQREPLPPPKPPLGKVEGHLPTLPKPSVPSVDHARPIRQPERSQAGAMGQGHGSWQAMSAGQKTEWARHWWSSHCRLPDCEVDRKTEEFRQALSGARKAAVAKTISADNDARRGKEKQHMTTLNFIDFDSDDENGTLLASVDVPDNPGDVGQVTIQAKACLEAGMSLAQNQTDHWNRCSCPRRASEGCSARRRDHIKNNGEGAQPSPQPKTNRRSPMKRTI